MNVYRCELVREAVVTDYAKSCDDINNILIHGLGLNNKAEEYLYLFCLDNKCGVIGIHEISHGDICSSIVSPQAIFKRALLNNATTIIIAHNHPSGDTTPSDNDIAITKRIIECGKMLGIHLLDHVIVGNGCNNLVESTPLF